MDIKELMEQLGEPDGVTVVEGGQLGGGGSGETDLIVEIMGSNQRNVSKLRAVMIESGIDIENLEDKSIQKILAIGYLVGSLHATERIAYHILPDNLEKMIRTSVFAGDEKTLEAYFTTLENAVIGYLDTETVIDIQAHDSQCHGYSCAARAKFEDRLQKKAKEFQSEKIEGIKDKIKNSVFKSKKGMN